LYYETRLSLSVFQRLLSLLASIVLATLPLADDETPLNSKREGQQGCTLFQSTMPEISTGCLSSAMFVDIIRASIHDRDRNVRRAQRRSYKGYCRDGKVNHICEIPEGKGISFSLPMGKLLHFENTKQ